MPTWVKRETQVGDCHTRTAWRRAQPWGTEIMVMWVVDGTQLCVARIERPGQNTWVQLCDTPRDAIRVLRGWRRILQGAS